MGADAGTWLIAICSTLAQLELYKLLERAGYKPLKELGLAIGFISIPLSYYLASNSGFNSALAVNFLAFVILSTCIILQAHKDYIIRRFFPTLLGFALIPLMLQSFTHILSLYALQDKETTGIVLCVWIIAVAKFTDVGGLIIGKKLGKNKLAPNISPNKTWEGVAGGLIASTIVGMLIYLGFRSHFPESFHIWHVGIFAIPIASLGIISDLIESILKRHAEAKDSGNIIPGIGGMYDLIDSLTLSAPTAYILFTLFLS